MTTTTQSRAAAPTTTGVAHLTLPCTREHFSASVRKELLLVAETDDWMETADTDRLEERVALYAQASNVVLCADVPGGLAALRTHYAGGTMAVLGGTAPSNVASMMNGETVCWPSTSDPLPADCTLVYVPPVDIATWQPYPATEVMDRVRAYPDTLFVVDERWYEFTGATCVAGGDLPDNLIVARSFNAAFGLRGLGIGYFIASPAALSECVARGCKTGVLPAARRAAMAALIDQGYMREYVETLRTTRRWVAGVLRQEGMEVSELPGPYLYIKGNVPEALGDLKCTSPATDGWIWAIGTPEQMEDVLDSMKGQAATS